MAQPPPAPPLPAPAVQTREPVVQTRQPAPSRVIAQPTPVAVEKPLEATPVAVEPEAAEALPVPAATAAPAPPMFTSPSPPASLPSPVIPAPAVSPAAPLAPMFTSPSPPLHRRGAHRGCGLGQHHPNSKPPNLSRVGSRCRFPSDLSKKSGNGHSNRRPVCKLFCGLDSKHRSRSGRHPSVAPSRSGRHPHVPQWTPSPVPVPQWTPAPVIPQSTPAPVIPQWTPAPSSQSPLIPATSRWPYPILR